MNKNYRYDEVEKLVVAYQEEQSEEVIEEIMRECQGLIFSVAKKYYESIRTLDLEDLVSEGNIVLWDAVNTFQPCKGCKFTTYLYSCLSRNYNTLYRFENAEKRTPGGFVGSIEQIESGTVYDGDEAHSMGAEELSAECIEYDVIELKEALRTIGFSDRENEVIRYLMAGRSKPKIAEILGVKTPTVHSYIKRIGTKLIDNGIVVA